MREIFEAVLNYTWELKMAFQGVKTFYFSTILKKWQVDANVIFAPDEQRNHLSPVKQVSQQALLTWRHSKPAEKEIRPQLL